MNRPSLRFAFDTNVLVSIAISRGTDLIHLFNTMEDYGILLYSDETLLELQSVLVRPKFSRYLSPEARVNFLQRYDRLSERVVVTETVSICRDPKDDKFLALAVAGRADYLVTGDADLLSLGSFRGIPDTPYAFATAPPIPTTIPQKHKPIIVNLPTFQRPPRQRRRAARKADRAGSSAAPPQVR